MKVNIFLTTISTMLALLIGYLAYNVAEGKENDMLCGLCTTICTMSTLITTIGLNYTTVRLGVNIRIFSFLILIIFLISHFCFASFGVTAPYYIVFNGILLLLYLAIFYKMQNIKSI